VLSCSVRIQVLQSSLCIERSVRYRYRKRMQEEACKEGREKSHSEWARRNSRQPPNPNSPNLKPRAVRSLYQSQQPLLAYVWRARFRQWSQTASTWTWAFGGSISPVDDWRATRGRSVGRLSAENEKREKDQVTNFVILRVANGLVGRHSDVMRSFFEPNDVNTDMFRGQDPLEEKKIATSR
jgi:hypothetical protein